MTHKGAEGLRQIRPKGPADYQCAWLAGQELNQGALTDATCPALPVDPTDGPLDHPAIPQSRSVTMDPCDEFLRLSFQTPEHIFADTRSFAADAPSNAFEQLACVQTDVICEDPRKRVRSFPRKLQHRNVESWPLVGLIPAPFFMDDCVKYHKDLRELRTGKTEVTLWQSVPQNSGFCGHMFDRCSWIPEQFHCKAFLLWIIDRLRLKWQ